ncbi:hypothetical protein ACOSP7_028064 [Xanthoceras sorbifolium]
MLTPTIKSKQATPSSSASQNGRLFTDSDEIRLLKTYYKFTKSNPSSSSSSSSSSPITVDPQTYRTKRAVAKQNWWRFRQRVVVSSFAQSSSWKVKHIRPTCCSSSR